MIALALELLSAPKLLPQVLCEDLSIIGKTRMVMAQPLKNFSHCPLYKVGLFDFSCLGIVELLALVQLFSQLSGRSRTMFTVLPKDSSCKGEVRGSNRL